MHKLYYVIVLIVELLSARKLVISYVATSLIYVELQCLLKHPISIKLFLILLPNLKVIQVIQDIHGSLLNLIMSYSHSN